MKPKLILCLALALICVFAGCSSLTTSRLHCTSLSREEEALVDSDLNRLLTSDGYTAARPSEFPEALGWFSPLRNGNADVSVSVYTNSYGMDIVVESYRGRVGANKALAEAIAACVKSNAPSALVNIQVTKDVFPLWPKE
jgi:hypothetical protein